MEDKNFLENMLHEYKLRKEELFVRNRVAIAEHEAILKQLNDIIFSLEKHQDDNKSR